MSRVRVTPGFATAGGVSPSITIGTHLWMHWLQVSSERQRAATAARGESLRLGSGADGFGRALEIEMHASMVAIAGASHAIDALYGEIKPLVPISANLLATWDANRTARHERIFETLKRGCTLGTRTNTWPRRFRALYLLRDPVVHHEFGHQPTAPHPNGLTEVSQEMADYCVENLNASLDLAFDVILTTLRSPKASALVNWAKPMAHVPAAVEEWRRDIPSAYY